MAAGARRQVRPHTTASSPWVAKPATAPPHRPRRRRCHRRRADAHAAHRGAAAATTSRSASAPGASTSSATVMPVAGVLVRLPTATRCHPRPGRDAGHRRDRPPLRRDHQSGGGHRRRAGHGGPCRSPLPTPSSSSFTRLPCARRCDPMPLLTEALRGAGAVLVDEAGHRYMPTSTPMPSWRPATSSPAPVWRRRAAGSDVFLDATHLATLPRSLPDRVRRAMDAGIDPRYEWHARQRHRALSHGRHRGRRSGTHVASRPVRRSERLRRPASTAPIGWRPTHCSKDWSSAPLWRRRCPTGWALGSRPSACRVGVPRRPTRTSGDCGSRQA